MQDKHAFKLNSWCPDEVRACMRHLNQQLIIDILYPLSIDSKRRSALINLFIVYTVHSISTGCHGRRLNAYWGNWVTCGVQPMEKSLFYSSHRLWHQFTGPEWLAWLAREGTKAKRKCAPPPSTALRRSRRVKQRIKKRCFLLRRRIRVSAVARVQWKAARHLRAINHCT